MYKITLYKNMERVKFDGIFFVLFLIHKIKNLNIFLIYVVHYS